MSRNSARQSNRNGRKKEYIRNHVFFLLIFSLGVRRTGCDIFWKEKRESSRPGKTDDTEWYHKRTGPLGPTRKEILVGWCPSQLLAWPLKCACQLEVAVVTTKWIMQRLI
jgi:hypothetical protein